MKIAIPVKMNKDNTALAPLFGKAKWIAFVEDGKVDIVSNSAHGGNAVVEWFAKEGVDTVIFQEMGYSPYEKIKALGSIALYHAGHERILLDEVLQKYDNGTLTIVDDANITEIIDHHEKNHTHGHSH